MTKTAMTLADDALRHILERIGRDGDFRELAGFGSETLRLVSEAYAELNGLDASAVRQRVLSEPCRPRHYQRRHECACGAQGAAVEAPQQPREVSHG